MKVLANDGISPAGKVKLEQFGFEVITDHVPQDDLIDVINKENYVALLVRSATKVRENLIDACPGLKLIGRGGVGMDNIDVDYARSKGLHVINTPAASSLSVAELVMAHFFTLARMLNDANRQMPSKGAGEFKALKKKYGVGIELRGKTMGIIGIGRIGQAVAKYALGCGMKVVAFDPFIPNVTIDVQVADQKVNVDITTVSLDDLLKQSDFITLHIPSQADGKPVVGHDEIAKMKDGVIVVNAARGGVLDEDDLLKNLDTGKVAAAALDVFVNEPTPRQDLLSHDKISATPHTGAATLEAQNRIGEELADQMKELLG